jgi:hypothetical protein
MISPTPTLSKPFSRNSVAAASRMRLRLSANFSRLTLMDNSTHPPLDIYMVHDI